MRYKVSFLSDNIGISRMKIKAVFEDIIHHIVREARAVIYEHQSEPVPSGFHITFICRANCSYASRPISDARASFGTINGRAEQSSV